MDVRNHFFDAFKNDRAGFQGVLDFFVMIRKNLLHDVHSTIVQQKLEKRYPLMNEGAGGVDAAQPLFIQFSLQATKTLKFTAKSKKGWNFFARCGILSPT